MNWIPLSFGRNGTIGGIGRLIRLFIIIPNVGIIQARSDIPAFAANLRNSAPVLWDIRSLWSEQRAIMAGPDIKITIDNSSLMNFLEKDQFDTLYHENYSYLTSSSVRILAIELGSNFLMLKILQHMEVQIGIGYGAFHKKYFSKMLSCK
jgi:hypothetical protein